MNKPIEVKLQFKTIEARNKFLGGLSTKPKPWNWLTFLKSAVKKEPSEEEWRKAYGRSASWSTCACCQLPTILRQWEFWVPKDYQLRRLGYSFRDRIEARKWSRALSTFLKIEARTAKLLKGKKKK